MEYCDVQRCIKGKEVCCFICKEFFFCFQSCDDSKKGKGCEYKKEPVKIKGLYKKG